MAEITFDIILPPLPEKDDSKPSRNLKGSKVEGDAILRLSPIGYCNWCGKKLTGRSKYYCPKTVRAFGMGHAYDVEDYWCSRDYTAWWILGRPRFKRAILLRDDFTCQSCGLKPETTNKHGLIIPDLCLLHIDHIVPFSKGGPTIEANLQVLCAKCNLKKKDKTQETFDEIQSQQSLNLK